MKIYKNKSLKKLNTLGIEAHAAYFAVAKNINDLKKASLFSEEKDIPIFVIGEGSNILIGSKHLKVLVVKLNNTSIDVIGDTKKHVIWKVGAGKIWDKLVEETVEKNLQGMECLSGIPGTVGAAPVQNIGAYGQELKDVFVHLMAFDTKKLKLKKFSKQDCQFGYRESVFKKAHNRGRYIIVEVVVKLNKNNKPLVTYKSLIKYLQGKDIENPTLKQVRKAILDLRKNILENPDVIPNAGSFFQNPIVDLNYFNRLKSVCEDIPSFPVDSGKVKLSAGWLVEKAGWKGKRYKNVGVSEKHALVITNPEGRGSAKEIHELADKISKSVKDKFGVKLEPEVQRVS